MDAGSRAPLAGATVLWRRLEDRGPWTEATTNADGEARIPETAVGVYGIRALAPGHAEDWTLAELPGKVTLAPRTAATLVVTGCPFEAQAWRGCDLLARDLTGAERIVPIEAPTLSLGAWAPGKVDLLLARGRREVFIGSVAMPDSGEVVYRMTVPSPRRVPVRVEASGSGQVVEEWVAFVEGVGDRSVLGREPADAAGVYVVSLPRGRSRFGIDAGGHGFGFVEVHDRASSDAVRVVRVAGGASIRVVATGPAPVEARAYYLKSLDATDGPEFVEQLLIGDVKAAGEVLDVGIASTRFEPMSRLATVESTPGGALPELTGLPARAAVAVVAVSPGGVSAHARIETGAEGTSVEAPVSWPPPTRLTVLARTPDRRPISSCEVSVWKEESQRRRRLGGVYTDLEGAATIVGFPDVEGYSLSFRWGPNFQLLELPREVLSVVDRTMDVALSPEETREVHVHVLDHEGRPAQRARVGILVVDGPSFAALTDATGWASLDVPRAGRLLARAEHGGARVSKRLGDAASIELQLPPAPPRLRIRIRIAVAPATVEIEVLRGGNFVRRVPVHVQGEGSVLLEGLRPGPHEVRLRGAGPGAETTVELREGETAAVTLGP